MVLSLAVAAASRLASVERSLVLYIASGCTAGATGTAWITGAAWIAYDSTSADVDDGSASI